MSSNPILSRPSSPLLAPAVGGGQAVTLYGQNLSGVSFVIVGASQIAPLSKTESSVTFKWPPNAASATPYDISVMCAANPALNLPKAVTSNVLKRLVYYLPTAVTNAWYAAEFFTSTTTSATWVDLIGGVAATTFGGLRRPVLRPSWSNGQPGINFDGPAGLQNLTQPALTQPGTVFVVGQSSNINSTLVAGGTAPNSWNVYRTGSGFAAGTPTANAGADLQGLGRFPMPCVIECVFDGASSAIGINGGSKVVGDAGAQGLTGITLGIMPDGVSNPLVNGYEGLVVVYDGVPTIGDETIILAIAKSIYAPVTATLQYTITPVPPVTLTQLLSAIGGVDLQEQSIQDITGCTFLSDTLTSSGGNAIRTIVFTLTGQFQSNFTAPDLASAIATGAWKSPFNSLYKHTLGAELGSVITESVVIAQAF